MAFERNNSHHYSRDSALDMSLINLPLAYGWIQDRQNCSHYYIGYNYQFFSISKENFMKHCCNSQHTKSNHHIILYSAAQRLTCPAKGCHLFKKLNSCRAKTMNRLVDQSINLQLFWQIDKFLQLVFRSYFLPFMPKQLRETVHTQRIYICDCVI